MSNGITNSINLVTHIPIDFSIKRLCTVPPKSCLKDHSFKFERFTWQKIIVEHTRVVKDVITENKVKIIDGPARIPRRYKEDIKWNGL